MSICYTYWFTFSTAYLDLLYYITLGLKSLVSLPTYYFFLYYTSYFSSNSLLLAAS